MQGTTARTLLLLIALLASAGPALASDPLFARLTTGRKDLYLQEVFDFTLSVYSRDLNLGREIVLLNQEAPGLNFLPFQDLGSRREVIDGDTFEAHRFLGRAQAVETGRFELRPAVRVSVVVPRRGRGAGLPDDRISGQAELRQVELHPTPVTVEVRPLPEAGRPEGFTGAVGSFTFSVAAGTATAVEGEPVLLTMDVRGRGNIESVAAPQVQADDRFKIYEPKLLRKEIGEDRSRGRLVFEQVLVPRSSAPTSLPAATFSYFDPVRKSYQRLVGGPLPLRVTPSAHPGAVIVEAPASGPAASRVTLRSEIAPLKPEPRDWRDLPARPWHGSLWLLALQFVPPGVVAALYFAVRRRDELARDEIKARRQLAPDAARSGIGAAEQALRAGDRARFHEAYWEAISSYFCHRFNLLPGEISRDAVTGRLSQTGLGPGDIARLGEIFRLSEQERFGRPLSAAAPLPEEERRRLAGLLDELNRLLRSCEKVAG